MFARIVYAFFRSILPAVLAALFVLGVAYVAAPSFLGFVFLSGFAIFVVKATGFVVLCIHFVSNFLVAKSVKFVNPFKKAR